MHFVDKSNRAGFKLENTARPDGAEKQRKQPLRQDIGPLPGIVDE
jgi:hypothetical protein